MTATDELRRLLNERGVEWMPCAWEPQTETFYKNREGVAFIAMESTAQNGFLLRTDMPVTPAQAIAATLGREPWVNPTWERWHKSLKHDEIKSIGDAVEQLMYEAIEFGGDMGPNGNTYNGIDEGDVLTSGFINEWIMRFESTLGRNKYSYKQWREISNAVGDAMEYAHNKAIECPDKADPLWNLDEYVNRILKAAFEGEATLGVSDATPTRQGVVMCKADETDTVECVCDGIGHYGESMTVHVMECSACGGTYEHVNGSYEFCPRCGRRIEVDG